MYTYNPHWGSSLVASRGQAERLPGVPFFFPLFLVCPFLTIHLFIQSFIHQFFFLCLFFHSAAPMFPKVGLEGRRSLWKRRIFPLFLFLPGIPVFSFYSLRSFVIFGRVSDTLVCLGNRVEGALRITVRGSEDTWEGAHVDEEGLMKGEEKVTKWHADMDYVNLIRLIDWQRSVNFDCQRSLSMFTLNTVSVGYTECLDEKG